MESDIAYILANLSGTLLNKYVKFRDTYYPLNQHHALHIKHDDGYIQIGFSHSQESNEIFISLSDEYKDFYDYLTEQWSMFVEGGVQNNRIFDLDYYIETHEKELLDEKK